MPQSTQKTLVRVLLWWTAILSIIQAVFVVLFFTLGHFGQSQDSSAAMKSQELNIMPTSKPGVSHDKGNICNFLASGGLINHTIKWYPVQTNNLPTSNGESGILNIKKDGYFFMCLRITLTKCNETRDKWTVTVEKNNDPILDGWIVDKTCSTGVLCKMKRLETGSTLKVKITNTDGLSVNIDENQNVTYLEIFYVPNSILNL